LNFERQDKDFRFLDNYAADETRSLGFSTSPAAFKVLGGQN
jgi:hypothetical protein